MNSHKPTVADFSAAYISGDPVVPTAAELSELRAWIKREFATIPVPVVCFQPQKFVRVEV